MCKNSVQNVEKQGTRMFKNRELYIKEGLYIWKYVKCVYTKYERMMYKCE